MKQSKTPLPILPPAQPAPSLGNILLPYQKKYLADDHPIVTVEKSRRVGITWTAAARAVLNAADEHGGHAYYLAYNLDVGRSFIDNDVKEWAERFNIVARKAQQSLWERDDETHESVFAYHVEFGSGHKIYALTSRPRSLRSRGRPGELAIIDEAAYHDDLPELLKAALAFTMLGGRVHIISTHQGIDSPFAELVNNIRAGKLPKSFSLHRVTIDDALAEGYYRHVVAPLKGEQYSPEAEAEWRAEQFSIHGDNADEELLVIPGAGAFGPYLPTVLIESRMRADIPVLRWECKGDALTRGDYALGKDAQDWIDAVLFPAMRARVRPQDESYFGMDFGRSGDLSVIWPLQMQENTARKTPFVIELRNVPYKQQAQILFAMVDRLPDFQNGAMDAGGNGEYLAESAQMRYGPSVEAIKLSIDWYRNNMPRYKAAFENGFIDLPRDAGFLADHRMVRMEKGVARIPDERIKDPHGKRHGDSVIAGALAYYATYANPEPGLIGAYREAVEGRRERETMIENRRASGHPMTPAEIAAMDDEDDDDGANELMEIYERAYRRSER